MRRNLPLILTLVAGLVATGIHWDVAPTFASKPMLTVGAANRPFSVAVKKALSPGDRCRSFNRLAAAREEQEQATSAKSVQSRNVPSDVLLITAPGSELFFPPALLRHGVFRQRDLLAGADRVALPPAAPRYWA
jgi:hypothetical protein